MHSPASVSQGTESQNMLLLTLQKLLTVHDRQLSEFGLHVAVDMLPTVTDVSDEQRDAGAAE